MTFFYNLNKKLDDIRATPELTHKQLNERDMSRAAKGYEKYGKQGMEALAKAGREGKALDPVRNKYDKYDEGIGDVAKKVGSMAKKVGGAVLDKVGHGSDADMIRDLQRKMGVPQTGKKPEQKTDEAAKWRDPKYKDKLYTQEPRDYDNYDYGDEDYYNPKPDNYPGEKNLKGGSEFDHNDPLVKGFGRSGTGSPVEKGPRKGLPSRNQITSLKGSIKSAKGTHAEPNLPEAGAPMTAKQKSFAKLAPPKDKITFADKIAGAKKEVDEMLGDVAAEAIKGALSGKQKQLDKNQNGKLDANDFAMLRKGGKKEVADEGWDDMVKDVHSRGGQMKPGEKIQGHKGEIEKTATGVRHTRRYDDKTGETDLHSFLTHSVCFAKTTLLMVPFRDFYARRLMRRLGLSSGVTVDRYQWRLRGDQRLISRPLRRCACANASPGMEDKEPGPARVSGRSRNVEDVCQLSQVY
jgi:hypothetical protein